MPGAFIYMRVSGLSQIDGYGFDRQEETCRAYAEKAGYEIVKVFREEGVSGTTEEADRPAFQDMMTMLLRNGVTTIIIESMDRLARELHIQGAFLTYLASKDVDLISARTEENVTQAAREDPLKKALIQIQGVFAELEKNQLVRRLRKGRERARAEGIREGRKPYGETPEERAVIRRVKALRRNRKGRPGHTLQEIADILNAEDIPTKTGGKWTTSQISRLTKRKVSRD